MFQSILFPNPSRWILSGFILFAVILSAPAAAMALQFVARSPNGNNSSSVGAPQDARPDFEAVELEVVFPPNAPPRDGARIAQVLSESGFDRAILRKATPNDEIGIERKMVVGRSTLIVTGGLHRGRLLLPGLNADPTDKQAISKWLEELKHPSPQSNAENEIPSSDANVAFGLTAEELVEVQIQLGTSVVESTKSLDAAKTFARLQTTSPILLIPSLETSQAVTSETELKMEFKGLAVGTALAAFARPRGMVLVPGKSPQGSYQLQLAKSDRPPEYWPVGWPTSKPLGQLAPKILQPADVDLRGQTLHEAFDLIALKSGVPILLDYNSLIANGIDPDRTQTRVRLQGSTWRRVMTAIAAEHKPPLKVEARIDDAAQTFFWISHY